MLYKLFRAIIIESGIGDGWKMPIMKQNIHKCSIYIAIRRLQIQYIQLDHFVGADVYGSLGVEQKDRGRREWKNGWPKKPAKFSSEEFLRSKCAHIGTVVVVCLTLLASLQPWLMK